MSLTANSALESARRTRPCTRTAARRTRTCTRPASSLESRNQTFLGSGGRNDSNSHQLDRIGENKIFHELDVLHVQKVGIKRFWHQEAEMTLTAISSLEWARRKFFMNSLYIMYKKQSSRKIFFSSMERADGCQTDFSLLSAKTLDSYFLDMM